MASIQESPHPLVFKVRNGSALGLGIEGLDDAINVRTRVRALEGMQKEVSVEYGPTRDIWRMVCDEGPYLNGTDLAPFPLSFFTAGLVSSYMSEILALAKEKGVAINRIGLTQDNRYTMDGSAIKGTMTGGAKPVEIWADIDSDASDDVLNDILLQAIIAAPGNAVLRNVLTSEFTSTKNGQPLSVNQVKALDEPVVSADEALFDALEPASRGEFADDIIIKLESAETVFNVEGGAGSSLQAEQKRELHVRGICTIREDGLKEISTQLFKPIGSVFRFLSDDSQRFGGHGRAPSGLAFLSTGIALCYMTQLGRFAHIMKRDLTGYAIVQDTRFDLPGISGGTGKEPKCDPVKTHAHVTMSDPDDVAQTLIAMGEQTCFLHATCRTALKTKVHIRTPAPEATQAAEQIHLQ